MFEGVFYLNTDEKYQGSLDLESQEFIISSQGSIDSVDTLELITFVQDFKTDVYYLFDNRCYSRIHGALLTKHNYRFTFALHRNYLRHTDVKIFNNWRHLTN
jgi:hypothetical protein